MTQKEIADRLNVLTRGRSYKGSLTRYVLNSITEAKSNYTVSNLIQYCQDMNVILIMEDDVTEEKYVVGSVMDVHNVLGLLMERYGINPRTISQIANVHYTIPTKEAAPLSIKTFLAVCGVMRCNLYFEAN